MSTQTNSQLQERLDALEAKLDWLMSQQRIQIAQPTGLMDAVTNKPAARVVFEGTLLEFYETQQRQLAMQGQAS